MQEHDTRGRVGHEGTVTPLPEQSVMPAFLSQRPLHGDQPLFIHFSSTPLFRLENSPATYAHLLRKKDLIHIGPIVNYFISGSGHVVYLGGEAVKNLYFYGKRKYKSLNMLAILTVRDVERYSCILNNIISSNDGAFSMGWKFLVRKNRSDGCFKDIAEARYIIEARLEGPEKLLYPFRPAAIELDLTTEHRFLHAFGVEVP